MAARSDVHRAPYEIGPHRRAATLGVRFAALGAPSSSRSTNDGDLIFCRLNPPHRGTDQRKLFSGTFHITQLSGSVHFPPTRGVASGLTAVGSFVVDFDIRANS